MTQLFVNYVKKICPSYIANNVEIIYIFVFVLRTILSLLLFGNDKIIYATNKFMSNNLALIFI
jgi:hypothetical protein